MEVQTLPLLTPKTTARQEQEKQETDEKYECLIRLLSVDARLPTVRFC